jgi:thiamine kinase-like enzyme
MKFEEYPNKAKLQPYHNTEQSEIFLTNKGTLIKHYFSRKDIENELLFYNLLKSRDLIKTSNLYAIGEDFIEIELLKKEKEYNTNEVLNEISKLYLRTINDNNLFPKVDLSKEKLFYRLKYLRDEIQNKPIDVKLIDRCEKFVEDKYYKDDNECIIHGDLKLPHIIPTLNGIKFIDFALARTTNPLYDLSFLCMEEQKDKKGIFKKIVNDAYFNLSGTYNYNKDEIANSIKSAMFYRTLYLFGFALRHRPQKSIDRIIKELEDIIII